MHVSRRTASVQDLFESLEARQLLATGFNPDGPVVATPDRAPTSIVTADFDGDSKPDLVMSVGREIIFQKGGGGGKFGAPRVLARLNTDAGLLGAGDLNGDGLVDLFSVEKGRTFGWMRTLMNGGLGRFTVSSYARSQTAVESVTVGNIDSDPEAEILLEGRSYLLTLGASTVPDEIRVLDPQRFIVTFQRGVSGPDLPPPLPLLKLIDRGVAMRGTNLAQPALADLFGTGVNNIIVGGQASDDVQSGFIQAFAYADPNPFIIFPLGGNDQTAGSGGSAPLFNPVGGPIDLESPVTSVGAADMNNDGKLDLVATMLRLTPTPANRLGFSDYQAFTVMLIRSGSAQNFEFNTFSMLESRTLETPPDSIRAAAPEYRIISIADINSDGKVDLGLSVIQDFTSMLLTPQPGGMRDAAFVQLLQPDLYTLPPQTGLFLSSYVSRQIATGLTTEAVQTRTQVFAAADIRRIGRPDLFIADITNPFGPTDITVRYNVQARALVPHLG